MAKVQVKGIDISKWQGNVDFKKVAADGVKFAIIRAGYRTAVDPKAHEYVKGCLANGIDVGLYWFVYVDTKTIEQNAQALVAFANQYKGKIKYKLWIDWEYDTDMKSPGYNTTTRSAAVRKFISIVNAAGFECGIYTNQDYLKNKFSKDLSTNYPLWIARYSSTSGTYGNQPNFYMWQYSSKGIVNGIKGNVDMDWCFVDQSAVVKPEVQKPVTPTPTPTPTPVVKPTTPTAIPTTITANVKSVQQWLNTYYNAGLKVDGLYGSNTKKALIKAWQKEVGGLVVDGSFGSKSKQAAEKVVLQKGSKGILVTIYQAALVCNKYNPNGIDGTFGGGCERATLSYKTNKGLVKNSIVDKNTWSKVFA